MLIFAMTNITIIDRLILVRRWPKTALNMYAILYVGQKTMILPY